MDKIEKWISENAYKYELTDERWDSGEDGWVAYREPSKSGIAQMFRDMIAAGLGREV